MQTERLKRILPFLILGILFYGCAHDPVDPGPPIFPPSPVEAIKFFEELDAAVHKYQTVNASAARVAGYPQLRADRFLAALPERMGDDLDVNAWSEAMRELDAEARRAELANLPDKTVVNLNIRWEKPFSDDREHLLRLVETHGKRLLAYQLNRPGFREDLIERVRMPSEYRTWQRIVGIYPLAALPIKAGTKRVQRELQAWHETPWGQLPIEGERVAYTPPEGGLSAEEAVRLLANVPRDALGRYRLTETDRESIARAFAPVWMQDAAADYDRVGELFWPDKGRIALNPNLPAVYFYFTHAFLDEGPALQANYVIWYPGRRGPNPAWFERGYLDGLTLRLTFGADGVPLMAEVMHNCGCYHRFVPDADRIAVDDAEKEAVFPFVPAVLPDGFPAKRLSLFINSGWHQVQAISTETPPNADRISYRRISYRMIPYDDLTMLPRPDGTRASIFNGHGIVEGTGRAEPILFFSVGIPKIGSMRQAGNHAIRMIGRSHFDDPELLDRFFILK